LFSKKNIKPKKIKVPKCAKCFGSPRSKKPSEITEDEKIKTKKNIIIKIFINKLLR
jgi:hypothetical protein